MNILNLYSGIGGNRKLWGDEHKITAIENNPVIAKIYQDFFPSDKVIITDAHQYLLDHFKEFDFIWSSPPCPTHSRLQPLIRQQKPDYVKYPDMSLYQEILHLTHWFKGKWCVENVISYYNPLILPYKINNHYFWTNYFIRKIPVTSRMHHMSSENLSELKGFDLSKYSGINKRQILRNCVEPATGLFVFNEQFNK